MANKKIPWKKILQAGAYATDAMSRGSAGGLGKAIVDSKIDLSGKFKKNGRRRNVQIEKDDNRLEVNKWKPDKDILGDFPNNKKTNYNV